MFTQPPFTFSDGINPPEPVAKTAWERFCPLATAKLFLPQIQAIAPDAVINDETYSEPGYTQVGDNPDKIGVYTVSGNSTTPSGPVDEWVAWLADRLVKPLAGIDKYPAPAEPKLTAKLTSGVVELSWQ